ncbi:MAG TPA: hypothetical protein VJM15_07685 [Sphingomicrobium sp.]|nr:hypothetical protein [Sphingomicrobium sp.]
MAVRRITLHDTVEATLFASIGIGVQLVLWLSVLRPLWGLPEGAAFAFACLGAILFGGFGFFAGRKRIYELSPRALWAFFLDVSWSAPNTLTGFTWLAWCLRHGTIAPPTPHSRKRGIILVHGPALPGADATTVGTVVGGRWLLHEAVHVQQARIFGPYYWPVYFVGYALNVVALVVTGRARDAHWGAYGRVVMEDWAYRAAPHDRAAKVETTPTLVWFVAAMLNAFGIALLLQQVPRMPWWSGAVLLVAYALVRSLFPRARWRALPHVP